MLVVNIYKCVRCKNLFFPNNPKIEKESELLINGILLNKEVQNILKITLNQKGGGCDKCKKEVGESTMREIATINK